MPSPGPEQRSRTPLLAGFTFAAAGVSHFIRPQLFETIVKPVFPRNTRKHVYANGGIETAIGLGLIARQTRPAALVGLAAYGTYLAGSALRNR